MTGKKGSLGRSSSLAKLMAQFHRRGSRLSLDSLSDSNWELKEARPTAPTFLTPAAGLDSPGSLDSLDSPGLGQDLTAQDSPSPGGDKKSIPVVRDPLGLSRPSLRPVSTNMLSQSKTRKNGPIKAMQPSLGRGDSINNNNENISSNYYTSDPRMSPAKSSGHQHHHHQQPQQHQQQKSKSSSSSKNRKFKDDMSMAQSQNKEKVTTNPYATIKMWRPVSMAGAHGSGATDGEVYQTFSNFDALRHDPASDLATFARPNGLPPTGDLRNQQQEDFIRKNPKSTSVNDHRSDHSRSPRGNAVSSPPRQVQSPPLSPPFSKPRQVNGFVEIPADYPTDPRGIPERRVSFQNDLRDKGRTSAASSNTSIPPPPPPPPVPLSTPPSLPNGIGGGTRNTNSSSNTRSSHTRPTTDLSSTAPAAMSSLSPLSPVQPA
ncbi:hypothetical protein EGW08_003932 [Elysia chlorotica]|uniref:Uncharacterized protein n=1 Tax=Elysia chlorotica TaxID=188477 RepID=A0A3S0ZWB7_ELYCH|nr:hypothetical protein EGW08_003932 [Elysia chlorotica]